VNLLVEAQDAIPIRFDHDFCGLVPTTGGSLSTGERGGEEEEEKKSETTHGARSWGSRGEGGKS
jgi:hypothetical protein